MYVPKRMDELSHLEVADLGDHEGQQSVGSNIERHAQEDVRAALIELAAKPLPAFGVGGHIKLKEGMARHQGHFRQVSNIPGADDEAAAIGSLFDLADELADLVHCFPIRAIPTAPL